MRRVTMTAPGVIEIGEAPPPVPGPGEVLLRIQRIGICGSDVHVNHGRHPFTTYPVVQGHEFSATVEDVGPGVEGVERGSKVTATPQVTCGACAPCLRGDYHICEHLKVQGFQAPGCAQDLFVTRAERLVPLPDTFAFEQGALVEPSAVGVHAIQRAGGVSGRSVLVLGAGPIGNLLAQIAAAQGARVLLTDVSPHRLDIARRCGIEATCHTPTEDLPSAMVAAFGTPSVDVAFDCAGAEQAIEDAITSVRKGGTVVMVAVYAERPRVNLGLVQDRELHLVGTLMYKHEDFVQAVDLIASGRITLAPLESRHFPLEQFSEAYTFIDQSADRVMKVFIDL